MTEKLTVYIHTNRQQLVGARVAAYAMKRASRFPDAFDVKLIELEKTPHLYSRQGQTYLRKGRKAVWLNEDLQSFSPLRRMVPQVMGYQGRAVLTDPDVFAIGDIHDLLTMDMGGKAILCRHVAEGYQGNGNAFYASSVMLLDCAKLTHWRWDDEIDALFAGKLDYGPWIALRTEDPATIGEIGEAWNSFDRLTPQTRLLHNTERSTQPWKTGLPVDFDLTTAAKAGRAGLWARLRALFAGRPADAAAPAALRRYRPHPDPAQETFFFELLRDALTDGAIDRAFIEARIAEGDVRPDAFEVLARVGYGSPPARRVAMAAQG